MTGTMQKPVYLLGVGARAFQAAVAPSSVEARCFSTPGDLFDDPELAPGLVVLGAQLTDDDLREAFEGFGRHGGEWTPVLLVSPEGGAPLGVPVSSASPAALADLLERYLDPEEARPVPSLPTMLRIVSRARHDINNPLTAALAETQLLLMDVEDGKTRTALEAIEEQLRRIRDLTAGLTRFREP